MVDKLTKALEGLKNIQFATSSEDSNISKKKMFFCVLAADVVVSVKMINFQYLPTVMESMINLCDDKDSDVRMVAEESLNRIIMSLSESNMLKVQVELHKIIKKNGPARCLRAALSRFGQLSHYIRPNKGKAHVQMLVPSLIEISKREEESVHETLASSLENIFKVLGVFTSDNNLKSLIKAFLHNLSSGNPVIRRCSASCIITMVQYCRKPHVFNSFVLNSLLDCIVPICEENSSDLVLGVLGCLRLLLPTLTCMKNDEGISGSFGLRQKQDESFLSVDRLIQIYELSLYYTNSKDHNIVAAALETLNQLLQNPPQQLELFFLSPAGFSRSYVHSARENKLWKRSDSEMSVACSLPPLDESVLLDVNDISAQFSTFSDDEQFESKQSTPKSQNKFDFSEEYIKMVENPFKEKVFGRVFGQQTTSEADSDTESLAAISDLNTSTNFLMGVETEDKDLEDFVECSRSNSRDNLYSPNEGEELEGLMNIDVGSFTDTAVPLIYCARHLAASFLLEGNPGFLISDRIVRVSIKSLALSCISAIIKLYPVVFKISLAKKKNEFCTQDMSDILLYCDHFDPQIRGWVYVIVGSFIRTALLEFKGYSVDWFSDEKSQLSCENLINILMKGLKDKFSVGTRQALSAVKQCMDIALLSVYNKQFLPVLEYLPALTNNSYWLVKVKLVEVFSNLPYVCIKDMTKSNAYQEEVIDSVLFPLLGDEDIRVRQATAEALVKIIPLLHCDNSTLLEYAESFTDQLNKWVKKKKNFTNIFSPCPPFSYLLVHSEELNFSKKIESTLSVIVTKLTYSLLVPKTKHFLFGYIEALKQLSQSYPTTVYVKSWNCWKLNMEQSGEDKYLSSNLINTVFSLLVASPFILDLSAYSSATVLLGNLFAGHCVSNLKNNYQISPSDIEGDSLQLWDVLKNEQLSEVAEEILTHLLRILNIYSRLLEEVPLSSVADSSIASNTILPLLSPIKKQEKKPEDKLEEKKPKNFNSYKQSAQYAKLQQLLKNAYTNFKISLDSSAGDKFLDLLESTLYSLSVLLEVSTIQETGRFAKEILCYLRATVSLTPCSIVICVIQLLKSLFGTNLASNWDSSKLSDLEVVRYNLFDNVFQLPTEFLSEKIRKRTNLNSLECETESFSALHRRVERKIKPTDKKWLSTYIRLFEPIVIKCLQLYTITGNGMLQTNVLSLLNQIVQLRVNYCLLDAKQDFVTFVLKQFELIEHGQMPEVHIILPHIFKFLVLLSYEKQHSKPIMSIPKILQLCDGLMASDQSVQTHCIPALVPVVEDVFLSKSLISSSEEKELETQREVLLSMLLRLAEFPRVMDLLTLILSESKTIEEKERWKRWSRQVMDTILPLASQDRLRIETLDGQASFIKLMTALSPNVFRPIDSLLKAMFVETNDYSCSTSLRRWLAKVTVFLEVIFIIKEDTILKRLEEISPNINLATFMPTGNLYSPDPFNIKSFFQVYEPSETFARFILKVICVVASKILESVSTSSHLQQKLSMFFICVFYVLKSGELPECYKEWYYRSVTDIFTVLQLILFNGAFHKISKALQDLLTKEKDSFLTTCSLFEKLKFTCPMLTCQFSYFLTLLNYCDQTYWSKILGDSFTLSAKLVQHCGVLAISDYLCDNLSDTEILHYLLHNNIREIVLLSHEIPITELLMMIRRKKTDWSVLLEIISAKNFDLYEPQFVEKLLRMLEMTENSHSAYLLNLLVKKFLPSPRLALSLLADSIACRQVEFLLTLPKEKVVEQIDIETFNGSMGFFKDQKYLRRHYNLWGLLKKLSVEVFNSVLPDPFQYKVTNTEEVQEIILNENWYFSQVKQRCCQKSYPGSEMPSLLSKLPQQKIMEIVSASDFNIKILKDCLLYSESQNELLESDNTDYKLLYDISKTRLLEIIKNLLDKFKKCKENLSDNADSFQVIQNLISENDFYETIWEMASCLTVFLEKLHSENLDVETEFVEDIADFGLLCLEIIEWDVRKQSNEGKEQIFHSNLELGLKCCNVVIRSRKVSNLLSHPSNRERLKQCVNIVFYVISHSVPVFQFNRIIADENLINSSDLIQLEFLFKFITSKSNKELLPKYLMNSFRDLIVNLCRVPELSSHILRVPESCDMQDIELLENFISRFSVIGWSSRQQFEEIWVALLAVLGFNTQGDIPLEESGFIVQASTVAVEGITTLLLSTMLDSRNKKLIHHGRDSVSMKRIDKLPLIKNICGGDQFCDRVYHFLDNLEISQRDDRYIHGLLSIEYLWTAVKQNSSHVDLYERHTKEINALGLDIPSCIYLLTELYNQWIYQVSPDIKIITSSLKSAVVISDLFSDISQFQWLLNFCLRVDEVVMDEDTVILPLIILGSCKAGSIVLPGNEVWEKIKKLMLRSSSLPCRIAAIQGLLYILQSFVVSCAVDHQTLPPSGSTFQTDEANFFTNIFDIFLPVALEIAQQLKLGPIMEEYELCHWSLIFYLLKHYQLLLGDLKDEFLNTIFSTLRNKNCSNSVMSLLVRGIERLLLTTVTDDSFRDQILKVSLDIISHNSMTIARHGLQLLTVLSFLDKRLKDIWQSVTGQDDPEKVMKDMEKINILFEKLKKSYPKEAAVIGDVIAYVLMDFSASDVLTKVIQEFLSSHQPHQKILAGLLFKVFQRAELSLLEDWVVFSLPSFIEGLPIAMSIWTLNCFFVSASSEPWLRSLFPLVQSRIRMAEIEDKKLLCLSASQFYKQLKQDSQKKSFVKTFEKVAKTDSIFVDILASLR